VLVNRKRDSNTRDAATKSGHKQEISGFVCKAIKATIKYVAFDTAYKNIV
jgi:hypothetical protein